MASPIWFLLVTLLFLCSQSTAQTAVGFRCTAGATTCNSLIDYKLPNTTSLSSLLALFQIKNLRSLLAANNLPLLTPPNTTYAASQILKIPFPCLCRNASGISNRRPNYTIVPDDGLSHIAAEVFSNMVTVPQIQAVNNIPDPDMIIAGQQLWVPLPCSCDAVAGETVVHYGHLVEAGSSVAAIAQRFNTTESTLLDLNRMKSSQDLKADTILDVPLKVCTSAVQNDSLDYPLLIPNATYTFTANNCVRCQCNAANNWILECEPSRLSLPRGQTCPSTQCPNNSSLGNTTSATDCNRSRCAYAGFTNGTIFTTVAQESTCPDNNSNDASKSGLRNWRFYSFLAVLLVSMW